MITLLRKDCNGNCAQGEGDCDDDKDCLPGLVCESGNWLGLGTDFGLATDFCKAGTAF